MTRGKISGHTRFGTSKVNERPILVTRNGCCCPANELPALTTFSQSPTILKSKEGSHLYVDSTQIQLRVEATILSCSNRACPHNPPLPPTKRCRATMYPLVLAWFCVCQLLFASDLETRASLQTVSRIYRFNCVSIASQPGMSLGQSNSDLVNPADRIWGIDATFQSAFGPVKVPWMQMSIAPLQGKQMCHVTIVMEAGQPLWEQGQ